MDFLALPRRDLQALCKRNAVRANMTNAAMADALRALPAIDGIEEYVKQLVAVPEPVVKTVAEEEKKKPEKQGSPLPRGRRATAKSSEPMKTDEAKEEENGDAKRQLNKEDEPAFGVRRRGASRRTSPVPKPAGKAEEEEGNPLAGGDEDPKREANKENVPATVVGRRDAGRRAPAVVAAAGKLIAEEEKRAPIPRGRRDKAKPTEQTRLDDNDEDERGDVKPEDKQEDAPVLGAGRRGGSRRARAAPAGKAEEEQKAPIPRRCHAKAKPTEIIMLNDSEEEKENTKQEKEKDAPAIVVGRRGASRRAPAHPPATKRIAATKNTEGGDAATESVPIRLTRQRRPTMKAAAAAAAAEDKAPRRATRRGAVRKTRLQQEEQEEPQEPSAVSYAEVVPAPVSDQGCDPEYSEEACDPQNEVLNEVAKAPPKQEDEVVEIIEDEKLMEDNPEEEPLVTDLECTDKPILQGQQVNIGKCPAPLPSHEDSPILGLVSTATAQTAGEDEVARSQAAEGFSEGALGNGVIEVILDAEEEMEVVPVVQVMHATLPAEEFTEDVAGEVNHESEKEICEVDTEDDLVSWEKEDKDIDKLQTDLVDDEAILDCSGNISQAAGEETNEVNTEYSLSCQEKGDVVVGKVLPNTVDETNILEVEKAGDIKSEMPENPDALDEDGKETTFYANIRDGNKPDEVVIGDSMSQITATYSEAVKDEKAALINDEIPQGAAAMPDNIEEDQFKAAFVNADQGKMIDADNLLPEVKMADCEIIEENTSLIVDEKQQSTAIMDDDVVEMEVVTSDEVPELKGTDDEVVVEKKTPLIVDEDQQSTTTTDRDDSEAVEGEKTTVMTDDMPNIEHTMDDCVMENHFRLHSEQKKAITADIVAEVSWTEDSFWKENAFTCDLPQEFDVAEDSNSHISPSLFGVTDSLSESIIIVEPPVFVAEETSVCKNSREKNTIEPMEVQEEKGMKVAKKPVDLSKLSLGQLRAELKKAEDTSVCKNSREKNITEPVAVQEEKEVKAAKKSVDLSNLSLGQLRAELKKKLNAKKEKEAKRVALARVDENVCRSHSKGQQQNLNLRQH